MPGRAFGIGWKMMRGVAMKWALDTGCCREKQDFPAM